MKALFAFLSFFVCTLALGAGESIEIFVGRNVAPGPKIRLSINTKNVRVVPLQFFRLSSTSLRYGSEAPEREPVAQGAAFRVIDVDVTGGRKANTPPQDSYYQRQINLPELAPGYYKIVAASGKARKWAVVNVTNLAVVVKRSATKTLTWVTDAATGRTVPGASVGLYVGGKLAVSGKTDKDGLCLLAPSAMRVVALVQRGGDMAAVVGEATSREGQFVAHVQLDRPIYRPGQSVEFKAILRRAKGIAWTPVADADATVEVSDSNDTLIERLPLKTNANGTLAGSFSIPAEGSLGRYTVLVRCGKESEYSMFEVAEYRKPDFKVTLTPSQKRYLAGEKLRVGVAVETYFGSHVPNATVSYLVRAHAIGWYGSGDGGFFNDGNMYARDVYYADRVVGQGRLTTDKNGVAEIALDTATPAPDLNYTVQVTVTDSMRRQVGEATTVPVFGANVRVGVMPKVSYVPLGRLFPLEVRLSDLDGKPVAGQVKVTISHDVYDAKEKRNVERVLDTATVTVPASGVAVVQLPASVTDLRIKAEVKDLTGRTGRAETSVYVTEPNQPLFQEPKNPKLQLSMDKRDFAPGDTAKAYLETDLPKRPVLVTVEGYDVFSYRVVYGSQSLTWKLTGEMCPNVEVDCTQWSANGKLSGNSQIAVTDPTRRLQVTVRADKAEYSPGDTARYTVTTLDSGGRPVSAEVALGVVDEALYAIREDSTEPLVTTFWGMRQNYVQTAESSPEEYGGGAFQAANPAGAGLFSGGASVRNRFVDTAYWNAFVTTGADGTGSVSFEVPGNLTAWRATARAVNTSTQVGEAKNSVRATRPLTLRLATPRQMAIGDEIDLIATVTNRTKGDQSVSIKVTVGGKSQEAHIVAPAGGDASMKVPILAENYGSIKVRGDLTDDKGVLQDALEVTVPVVPIGAKFRYVTAGALDRSELSLELPADVMKDTGSATLTLFAGNGGAVSSLEDWISREVRYSPVVAAAQLRVAIAQGKTWQSSGFREPLAMLGRTRQGTGWGWFDDSIVDPVVTARVVEALADAQGIEEAKKMVDEGRAAAEYQYEHSGFMEDRAMLIGALSRIGTKRLAEWAKEVDARSDDLSPTARMTLAEALWTSGNKERAAAQMKTLLPLVSRGASESYLPVGRGEGWAGGQIEANARLLHMMLASDTDAPLASQIANWLANAASCWASATDRESAAWALREYETKHPGAKRLEELSVTVDGKPVAVKVYPNRDWASVTVPVTGGKVSMHVEARTDGGAPRYVLEANVYRPVDVESPEGLRTFLRWEVQNAAGSWEELGRDVKPNEPVRCTAVVWGDALADTVKVAMPIPAGFEYVDRDSFANGRAEVRDGAVVYYTTLHDALPAVFRFYLRAETDGRLIVPPVQAELLRRPDERGHTAPKQIVVKGQ